MKLKRIKKLKINSREFDVLWDKTYHGAKFNYSTQKITIGLCCKPIESVLLEYVVHELWEIVAIEMHVRLNRPDCDTDYIFVYDHRQHDTMCCMFSGLLEQFLVLKEKDK